jgi:hypothetical protein
VNRAIDEAIDEAVDEADAVADAVTDGASGLIKWSHFRHLTWLLQLGQSTKPTGFSFA